MTVGVRDDGKPDRRHVERKAKAEVTKAVRALARSVSPAGFGSPARCGRSGSGLSTGSRTSLRSTSARTPMTATKSTYVSSSCPASEPTSSIVWSPSIWGRFTPRWQASRSSADTAHHVHRTVRVFLEDVPTRSHHDQRRRDRPSASTIGPPEPVVKLLRKHQEEQEREPGSQGSSGRTRGPLIPGTTGGSNSLPTPAYVMVACLLLARLLGPCFFCSGSRMSWWTRSQVGRLGGSGTHARSIHARHESDAEEGRRSGGRSSLGPTRPQLRRTTSKGPIASGGALQRIAR